MFSSKRFLALAGTLIVLNVAGLIWIHYSLTHLPPQRLRVLEALPEVDAEQADRLAFLFDQPLAKAERVGQAPEQPILVVEPAARGRWVWAAEDRLEYVLDEPLPRGRVYTVKFADDLEARLGRRIAGERSFRFETGALDVTACNISSSDRSQVGIEIAFNQPVDGEELLRRLKVRDPSQRGLTLAPALLTQKPGDKHVLMIPRPQSSQIELTIAPELVGFGGQLPLGEPFVRRLQAPRGFTLLRAECYPASLDKNVRVTLHFSSQVDRNHALPAVKVEPAVEDLRVERGWDGLYLIGPFVCGKRYKAIVPATLLSQEGRTLDGEQSVSFDVPDRRCGVDFRNGNGVLSPQGNLALELTAVNAAKVELAAWRLHANNLVPHLHGQEDETVSREVLTRTLALEAPRNEIRTFALDLRSMLKQPKGVYRITANTGRYRYDASSSNVCITDLALTSKAHREGLTVWVTSIREGRGQAGVKVSAVSRNNQVLATALTGADGLADLAVPAKHPDGAPWVVIAELKDDLSYLQLNENRWVHEGVNTGGRAAPTTYDVMLYAERGIYRPGDTIHLTGIVRDANGQVPPAFPLAVKVVRPDGRQIADLLVKPEAITPQGTFHVDHATAESDATGFYDFTAHLPGAPEPLGEVSAMVEAFVPVRMEVKAAPASPRVGPAQDARLNVSARYLWGQPAAELGLVVRGSLVSTGYQSQKYPHFTFSDGLPSHVHLLPENALSLDADGKASVLIPLDAPALKTPRCWSGSLTASVTETGGRSVSANASISLDRMGRHVGLRTGSSVLAAGKPFRLEYVLVDADDKPIGAEPLEMTLHRIEWDTALREVNGQMVWKSVERAVAVGKPARLEGKPAGSDGAIRQVELTCSEPGRYRVLVTEAGTPARGQLDFYVSYSGDDGASLSMNEPERLEIVLDRERYEPGQKAKVLVRSPIPGTMLLCLEGDRILHRRLVQIQQRTAQVELDVPADLRGGAFVSASVVRPVDPSRKEWLPHRAMGLARLRCDRAGNRLELAVKAPDKVLPGSPIDVTVDTFMPADPARPAVVHLWAVDEGILLTTQFATPDPLAHFLAPRRLGVETCDLFGSLLPDYERPKSMARIGAGGDDEMEANLAMRRSTVPLRQRAAGVVWAGCGTVDMNGRYRATLRLPDLTGRMRLMAAVADGDLYGSARHDVIVTAPLLVEASWPRFAAPGDRFEVPLKLFNNSDRDLAVKVDLDVHGPVAIEGGDDLARVAIAKGTSVVKFVRLRADAPGQVEARCNAVELDRPGGLAARCEALLGVRTGTVPHALTRIVTAEAGKDVLLQPGDEFVPGTARARLVVSGRPNVQLRPALEQLLDYPYGCLEQTTSRLSAILYVPDLIALDSGADDARAVEGRKMVDSGIFRLWSMQTPSGGLGYWSGDRQPNLWGTAYACETLIQARLAGYKVDPRFMSELVKYLQDALNITEHSRGEEWAMGTAQAPPTDNMRAMIVHLLALEGKPAHGWMARLAERLDTLDMGGRAHLAGAFVAAGRKDRAMAVLPRQTIDLTAATTTSGELTAQVRQEALLLSVLLDIEPANPWVDLLAQRIEKARTQTQGHWGTTLCNAAALSGLARYQLKRPGQGGQFSGTIQAAQAAPVAFDHTRPVTVTIKDFREELAIRSSGTGRVFVALTVEGQAREGVVKPFQRNLLLQRRWLDRKGMPIQPDKIKVGDLVQVELSVHTVGLPQGVGNLAIVDALPGGLEVENPKLATSAAGPSAPARPQPDDEVEAIVQPSFDGVQPAQAAVGRADRCEFLDDRVLIFTSATASRQVFRYSLRATTAGKFSVPPAQASCMYEPAVAALGEGGMIEVVR